MAGQLHGGANCLEGKMYRVRWGDSAIVCANCNFQGYFIINSAEFFFNRVDQLFTYKMQ